jgi:hypothetical protein
MEKNDVKSLCRIQSVLEALAASHILVLSIIPQPIISACNVNLGQSFDKSFGLLFGGTMDKTLFR